MSKAFPTMKETIKNMFTYHPPKTDSQIERYTEIRNTGKMFAETITEACPAGSDEFVIALQKIREAVMWANASIACNE